MTFRIYLLAFAILSLRIPVLFAQGSSDIHWIDWPTTYSFRDLRFSPDGSHLSAHDFIRNRILVYPTLRPQVAHEVQSSATPLSFLNDTTLLVFTSLYDTKQSWINAVVFESLSFNGVEAPVIDTLKGKDGAIYTSGVLVYTSILQDTLWSRNLESGNIVQHFFPRHAVASRFFLSMDGSLLCFSTTYGDSVFIDIYETSSGELSSADTLLLGHYGGSYSTVFLTPDNSSVVLLGLDHVMKVFDLKTKQLHRRIVSPALAHDPYMFERSVVISRDGKYVAATADDGTIHLWDFATGEELHVYDDYPGVHAKLAFSPDNRYLASTTWDGALILWNGPAIVLGVDASEPEDEIRIECAGFVNRATREARFDFVLPHADHATLDVYDLNGCPVARPLDERLNAGNHTVQWNAEHMPDGIYFYRLTASGVVESGPIIISQ